MHRIEVHNIISNIMVVFRIFGLWDDDHRITKRKLFSLIVIATMVIALLCGALESDVREEAAFLVAGGGTYGVQLVKLFYIIWKRNEILEFIHKSGVHTVADYENFTQVNNKIDKFTKVVAYVLCVICIFVAIVLICFGVFGQHELPVKIAFPLDWRNSETGYWLAFAYFAAVIIYALVIFLFNVILWYVMLNFSLKYQLLGNNLRRLGINKETEIESIQRRIWESGKQHFYLIDLITAIENHRNLRETIEQFRSCFANLFFIQIATSSMCICGSVQSLAFEHLKDLLQSQIYILLLIYSIFDILMTMYLGHEIEYSSDQLLYCLFESNWIEQSRSCRNDVVILAELLKKPQKLVICKLYPLNLVTFTAIANLAFSMFNILRNVTN